MYAPDNNMQMCRPDVLSLDSDFSSSTGPLDSPEQNDEALSGQLSITNTTTFVNNFEADSSAMEPLAKTDSCCTLPMAHDKNIEFYRNRDEINYLISRYTKQTAATNESKYTKQTDVMVNDRLASNVNTLHNGNANSSRTKDSSLGENMDMRYAEMTHRRLTSSLNQIQDYSNTSELGPASTYILSRAINSPGLHRPQESDAETKGLGHCVNPDYLQFLNSRSDCTSSCHSKLADVLQVKEELLQEKEVTILKLQLQVSSLQHQTQETEAALRQVRKTPLPSHCSSSASLTSTSYRRLQEQKAYQLEQALGKTENKLFELSSQFKHEKKEMEKTIRKLQDAVKHKEQTCNDLKKKNKSILDRLDKSKGRVESLERYLADLPTMEESSKLQHEANLLGKERENLVIEISDCKIKLERKNKIMAEKNAEITLLQEDVDSKVEAIKKLQARLVKSEKSKEKLGPIERDELEELRDEVMRLQQGKGDASRLVAGSERRVKMLKDKHQQEIEKLQNKVDDAEEMIDSVREELGAKHQAMNQINLTLKSVESQNQEMLDEKLSLQDKVKNLEDFNNNMGEVTRVYYTLQREANAAAQDLRGITQVLIETLDGADPNISALLGVRSDTSGWEEDFVDVVDPGSNPTFDSYDFMEQASKRLIDVRQLRKDINQLRSSLTDQYADSIGSNCTTQ